MAEDKSYRELAIDALKESDICKGYKDFLLAILEITEDQALDELRYAVRVEHEEYKELKKKMKEIKKLVEESNIACNSQARACLKEIKEMLNG